MGEAAPECSAAFQSKVERSLEATIKRRRFGQLHADAEDLLKDIRNSTEKVGRSCTTTVCGSDELPKHNSVVDLFESKKHETNRVAFDTEMIKLETLKGTSKSGT